MIISVPTCSFFERYAPRLANNGLALKLKKKVIGLKKLKIITLIVLAVIIISGAFVAFVLIDSRPVKIDTGLDNALSELIPPIVNVNGASEFTQPDAFTGAVTTISVVESYIYAQDITPQALIEKYNLSADMQTDQFIRILSEELPDYSVTSKPNQSQFELISGIHDQLMRGIPVPVFFGAANPYNEPYYDFHASVVTGVNLGANEITVQNVYGYVEKITLQEFLNRMAYRPTGNYPFIQKAVIKLGLNGKNTYVEIMEK